MPIRPERKLRVVTASAPAKPELRFQIEPFYVIARELPPLFKQHWRELGRNRNDVPLDPDWDSFMQQAVNGRLRVLTARDGDELVGYVFTFVGSHLHYKSTLHAMVDMFWLAPRYRTGWTGMKLLQANEKYLDSLGVVRRLIGENLQFKGKHGRFVRLLFRRLGYKACDVHYSKVT